MYIKLITSVFFFLSPFIAYTQHANEQLENAKKKWKDSFAKSLVPKDVSGSDCFGNTPLHNAVKNQDQDQVLHLLGHGADINTQNRKGLSPLKLAIKHRIGDRVIIKYLLSYCESVDAPCGSSENCDCESILHPVIKNNRLDILELLLKKGAKVDGPCYRVDKAARAPLLFAVKKGRLEMVKLLLKYGATTRAWDYIPDEYEEVYDGIYGWFAPLHIAAMEGNVEILNYLLESSANLMLSDDFDDNSRCTTALHVAVMAGRLKMVEHLLVAIKALGKEVKEIIETGIDEATEMPSEAISSGVIATFRYLLKERLIDENQVKEAAIEAMERFYKENSFVDILEISKDEGLDALVELINAAVEVANQPPSIYLNPNVANKISSKINTSLRDNPTLGRLLAAALIKALNRIVIGEKIDVDFLKAAISAMVNAQDYRGKTPLNYAAWYNGKYIYDFEEGNHNNLEEADNIVRLKIAQLLLNADANPNIKDKQGKSIWASLGANRSRSKDNNPLDNDLRKAIESRIPKICNIENNNNNIGGNIVIPKIKEANSSNFVKINDDNIAIFTFEIGEGKIDFWIKKGSTIYDNFMIIAYEEQLRELNNDSSMKKIIDVLESAQKNHVKNVKFNIDLTQILPNQSVLEMLLRELTDIAKICEFMKM
ncbi:MAG: ankyrin repeat domain-containing protein [Myxococcales bacterium]|nr:ankyrin repeat domain-containing protein [Myxococcales bacterium]USN51216.1 MAG: ankyrin repeat domain-containing protein [Myxococcales bacterium]